MIKFLFRFRTLLIVLFLSFQFSISSQSVHKWYQDGVLIFQLKNSSYGELKSKNKIVDFKSYNLFSQFSDKYQINSVIQLYPNHKNQLLANTFQIEFDKVLLVDAFSQEMSKNSAIEYAEKKRITC